MAYRELGEAQILKRYAKTDYVKPARRPVSMTGKGDDWQTLSQATSRFLQHVKPAIVTARN
ncbi:hypothetical protein RYZ26_18120 [Terasakiella sp. A23]|uniref:hypothetical protein n=1 Tax=Terasakiella sp. FCG-A23 TaxID=3080561 RepID=UPI0029530E1F|nr:hypothetical protein [Terasakiella sp. A23]MDV7341527.1 hypothetical protein [Terasakiella sp. A23]